VDHWLKIYQQECLTKEELGKAQAVGLQKDQTGPDRGEAKKSSASIEP
jgi:hypothetical protein